MLPEWASWLLDERIEEKAQSEAAYAILCQIEADEISSMAKSVKECMVKMDRDVAAKNEFAMIEDYMDKENLWDEFLFQVNIADKWNFSQFNDLIKGLCRKQFAEKYDINHIRLKWLCLVDSDECYDSVEKVPDEDMMLDDLSLVLYKEVYDMAEDEFNPDEP